MFFLESPWPFLFLGIVAEAILALTLVRTKRAVVLAWMAGVAILAGAALAVERWVVTDDEAISATLDTALAAIKADNTDHLLQCISPSAEDVRKAARWAMDRIEVQSGAIGNLNITINRLTPAPTAHAKFFVKATGRYRSGQPLYDTVVEPVTVELQLENGQWLITGYSTPHFRGR